jgi:hypothetical protein
MTLKFVEFSSAGGWVGGAVIGGALGFIQGVGAGVTEQLLASCFR